MNETSVESLDARGGGWRAGIVFAAVGVVFAGLVYPWLAVSVSGALFPEAARGSLVEREGQVVGSLLMAQPFADDRYFISRPSAANYSSSSLAGSNWAPSQPALRERAQHASAAIAAREGVTPTAIPVELVAASGSGIDPHLSPAAAMLQAPRVARARSVSVDVVNDAIARFTEAPSLGVLGQPRVNVLALNLWLDEHARAPADAGHAGS